MWVALEKATQIFAAKISMYLKIPQLQQLTTFAINELI